MKKRKKGKKEKRKKTVKKVENVKKCEKFFFGQEGRVEAEEQVDKMRKLSTAKIQRDHSNLGHRSLDERMKVHDWQRIANIEQ